MAKPHPSLFYRSGWRHQLFQSKVDKQIECKILAIKSPQCHFRKLWSIEEFVLSQIDTRATASVWIRFLIKPISCHNSVSSGRKPGTRSTGSQVPRWHQGCFGSEKSTAKSAGACSLRVRWLSQRICSAWRSERGRLASELTTLATATRNLLARFAVERLRITERLRVPLTTSGA